MACPSSKFVSGGYSRIRSLGDVTTSFAAKVKLAPPKQQLPEITAEAHDLQILREELETVRADEM